MDFKGSLVLVGGDPGVGKSTLLLQVVIGSNLIYIALHRWVKFSKDTWLFY